MVKTKYLMLYISLAFKLDTDVCIQIFKCDNDKLLEN